MRINLYLTFLPRCEVCAAGLSYNCFFFWSQTILPRTKQTDEGNENKSETPNLSAHSQRGHHLIMLLPRKAWDQASGKLILLSIHFKSVLSTHIFYNLKPKELLEFQFSVFFLFFFQFSLSKTKLQKLNLRRERREREEEEDGDACCDDNVSRGFRLARERERRGDSSCFGFGFGFSFGLRSAERFG